MIRNIRYRRDQRQMEEEEEIWFSEEDDFTDVVPTSKPEIEPFSTNPFLYFIDFILSFSLLSFSSRQMSEREKRPIETIINDSN